MPKLQRTIVSLFVALLAAAMPAQAASDRVTTWSLEWFRTPAPPSTQQFVTITQPARIKIAYGETVLPRGLKLPVVSRNGQTVIVKYLEETPAIPLSSTDLK